MAGKRPTAETRSGSKGISGRAPEAVRIKLLGGFSVSVGSRTIDEGAWRLRKAAALVKLLALSPGHRLHREQAMDLLWPDSGRRGASNNLRRVLHAARRVLDPAEGSGYIASEEESLVLCPDGLLWVDVEAFEQAASTARRSREPTTHEAALDLYAGDLLPADRYEEWAEEHRRQLRETYLKLLLGLARIYEERSDHDSALKALRRVVAEEPTREEAHVGLMRVYALAGSNGEALTQYGHLEEVLSEQLGAQPAASSRALREEIAAGRFPPVEARLSGSSVKERAEEPPHNLPLPRTSFVGRERELVEVERALAMTRLLTLTGAGGSGKTRLALEVARKLVGAYPDGAWLVELAPLSEPELMPQQVAGVLGVREQTGRPLEDAITEALRDKEMLLVVDNCEHLVEATAVLADLLVGACPKLRVLATSREPLRVEGEALWPVPPLSVPGRLRRDVTELSRSESVRLFVERARLKAPGFALTLENAEAVAEVCRRLEGVPLAIELAAARIRALSVEQLAERLGNSLELLSEGPRTAAPRQRTMRATLEWSYGLLSEEERALFGRLSVFAGGWTLEAAEAVCQGSGIEAGDVLSLVSSLTDKSLVVAATAGSGAVRYGMLEPVRHYAREKLEESGEADAVRRRHAAFFLALAEEAEPELRRARQAAWLEQLEHEHDNFRAALSWALESGESELGTRLCSALRRFWLVRGYWDEGRKWLDETLATNGAVAASVRAKALYAAGMMAEGQGDYDRALVLYEEGLSLYRKLNDSRGMAACLGSLGWVAVHRGDHEWATEVLEESLARYGELGDKSGVVSVLPPLGALASRKGDQERAMAFVEESLVLYRELEDVGNVALSLSNLGWLVLVQGDHERAAMLLKESLARLEEAGLKPLANIPMELGLAELAQGDNERATELLAEGLTLSRQVGDKLNTVKGIEGMAVAARAQSETERAARLWGAAEMLREAMSVPLRPDERAVYEPYIAEARSQLDVEAWEAALAEGRAMTLEEAAEHALSEDKPETRASERQVTGETPTTLTRREQEIAALVARGLTNRQIASELSISEHTAATHVAKILKKLGLRSRAQIDSWLAPIGSPPSDY